VSVEIRTKAKKLNNINNIIEKLGQSRVLLVGDIMLDHYVYGSVGRISPEGPIPVLKINHDRELLGGVGNVFANLKALGAKSTLISMIGNDENGQKIESLLDDTVQSLLRDSARPTTIKTRYIANNQQLLRTDMEEVDPISIDFQDTILKRVKALISDCDILVLSDYGKGLLTPHLIKRLIAIAKKHKVPSLIDPKHKDFSVYKGVTYITPNKKELSEAADNMPVSTDDEIEAAGKFLIKKYGVENVIATRSEDGISFISKKEDTIHSRTQTIAVYDVSGAGDTVVAVLAAAIGAKAEMIDILSLTNKAGAIVVSKPGTATVTIEELQSSLAQQNDDKKLKTKQDAKEQIQKWQAEGLKVGFTNGCFDILHHGHVTYLQDAKKKCDRLVVGLNHDQSVRILKGPQRPINDQEARASVLSALTSVDMVVLFGAEQEGQDNTPCEIVDFLKPDIFTKGGDYTIDDLPEAKIVKAYGGQVEIMPVYEGYSTSNIIEKAAAE